MSRDDSDPHREALHDAIAEHTAPPGGGVLVGWLVAAEWMTRDGERRLTIGHAASTSPWTAKGMAWELVQRPTFENLPEPPRFIGKNGASELGADEDDCRDD